MQRSLPILVPGCCVAAVLDQKLCELDMTQIGPTMQCAIGN